MFYHIRKSVQNIAARVVHIYGSKKSPLIYRDKKGRFFKAFFAAFLIFGYFFRENCRKAQSLGILMRCFCLYYRKLY